MKIVVAHAVLRALGAEFRRFDDDKSQIADAKVRRMFRYQYVLDINRLFYFAPVLRTMWIVVLVENPLQTPLTRDAPSDLRITAYFPNLVDGVPHVDREELACPPIPQI
jgi:hypothetical protein